jgi:hypothetical protein
MNKTLMGFVYLVMLLITMFSCLAVIQQSDIIHAWEGDGDNTDATGNFTLTSSGTVGYSAGVKILGTNSFDLTTAGINYLVSNFVNLDEQHAISLWLYQTGWRSTSYGAFLSKNEINGAGASNEYGLYYHSGGTGYWINSDPITPQSNLNAWSHIVITYDGANMYYYINGTYGSMGGTDPTADGVSAIFGAFSTDLDRGFNGYIDEIMQINRNISLVEVQDLYNSGVGKTYADYGVAPVGDTLNISTTYPSNNTQYNTLSLSVNTTVDSSDDFDCDLYVNTVLNQTDSFTAGTTVPVEFNLTFASDTEETFAYYLYCNSTTGNETTPTSTFYVDNVLPNIDFYTPLNDNSTKVNLNDSLNFTTNISLTDPNIYSYEYNITYTNGTVIYNYSNTSLTGLTGYNLTQVINMSGYTGGFYATATVCDGHTNNNIKDMKVTKSNTELMFDDIKIIPLGKTKIKQYNSLKKTDRYEFEFKTNKKSNSISFYVESPDYIDILDGKTEYAGHLVTGKNWIDFEILGLQNVIVTRINDNKVKVEVVADYETDLWHFKSIGELNCKTETRSFFVFDEVLNYEIATLSAYTNKFDLSIDYAASYFSGYVMNASLVWNGTSYLATGTAGTTDFNWSYNHTPPTIVNDTNVTFYWNYTLDGTTYYQTDNLTQEIINPRLTNCSQGTNAISFILNEEDDLRYLNGNAIDVDFSFWNPDGNASQISYFGYTYLNTYNATVCIYPSFAILTGNAYIINNVNTSYSHRYYFVNANFTNLTSNPITVNLYNFEDTLNKNTLEVNVVDQFYNPISDIIVKLQRYYPSGTHQNTSVSYAHSWHTVQVDKSDEFGKTVFHVSDNGDTDYYFILESNNSILKQTATMKLLCPDPTDCKVTFQIDTSVDNSVYSLFDSFNWTYDETTEIVTVSWNDPTLLTSSIGVSVTQEKSDGQLSICSQVFATPTGIFTCNTTGYSGMLRVTAYRTASPLVKFLDEFIDKYTAALATKLNGEGALWGAFIFIGIVTASATSVIGVVIASIIGLVIIFISGITSIVTLTFLVMASIVGLIIAFKLQR